MYNTRNHWTVDWGRISVRDPTQCPPPLAWERKRIQSPKRFVFKFLEYRTLGKVQKPSESETLSRMKQEKSKFVQEPPMCTYKILTLFVVSKISKIDPNAGSFSKKATCKFHKLPLSRRLHGIGYNVGLFLYMYVCVCVCVCVCFVCLRYVHEER
jgi:hypothetical protein